MPQCSILSEYLRIINWIFCPLVWKQKQTTFNSIKLDYFSDKQPNDLILKCLKSQIFTLIFAAFQEIDWLKCFSFFGVKDIGCILQTWIWNMTHAVRHSLSNDKIQFYIYAHSSVWLCDEEWLGIFVLFLLFGVCICTSIFRSVTWLAIQMEFNHYPV